MDTQNLTLRLPKSLLQKAKRTAAARGTTITRLVIDGLTRAVNLDPEYQSAFERQRLMMESAEPRRTAGENMPSRDSAHER
jgi:hypothetical protein